MDSKTELYSTKEFNEAFINSILQEVYIALEERGYQPINQLVGYLMSGDPGYISSYKDARKKIVSVERDKIIEFLLCKALGDTK